MRYDIAAAILLAAVLIFFQYKKSIHRRQNLYYLFLVVCLLSAVSLHAICMVLERADDGSGRFLRTLEWTGTISLMLFMAAVALFSVCMAYVLGLAVFLGRKFHRAILDITSGMMVVLLLNPLTHWFFRYEGKSAYHRGSLMLVFFLVVEMYLVIVASHIIRQKELLGKRTMEMLLIVFLVMASVVLQAVCPEGHFAGFLSAVAVTGLLLAMDSEAESVSSLTGLKNRRVLIGDVNRMMNAGEKAAVITIYVTNLQELSRTIKLKEAETLETTIASWLDSLSDHIICYQYNENVFALILPGGSQDQVRAVLYDLYDRFQTDWQIGRISIVLQARIRSFRIPDDCASIEDFMNYLTVPDPEPQSERVKVSHADDLDYVR